MSESVYHRKTATGIFLGQEGTSQLAAWRGLGFCHRVWLLQSDKMDGGQQDAGNIYSGGHPPLLAEASLAKISK